MSEPILLTLAALVTATISGTFGMAGGALLIGIMASLGMDMATAVPVHGAVQLISNATRTFAHAGNVRRQHFIWHALVLLPFPFLGVMVAAWMPEQGLRLFLGVLIIYAAWAPKWGLQSLPDKPAFMLSGAVAGFFGVIIGASGPLIAPFFLRPSFDRHQLIATKAACQLFNHFVKIVAFSALSFSFVDELDLIVPMGVAVIAGTYIGKALLKHIDEKRFKLGYRVLLTGLAARILWTAARAWAGAA